MEKKKSWKKIGREREYIANAIFYSVTINHFIEICITTLIIGLQWNIALASFGDARHNNFNSATFSEHAQIARTVHTYSAVLLWGSGTQNRMQRSAVNVGLFGLC